MEFLWKIFPHCKLADLQHFPLLHYFVLITVDEEWLQEGEYKILFNDILKFKFLTSQNAGYNVIELEESDLNNSTFNDTDILRTSSKEKLVTGNGMVLSGMVIFTYVVLSALREIIQFGQQRYHYLFDPNNFVSWLLYINALFMISPIFRGGLICDYLYSAASMTVFLSWFNLLLHLQRFDQIGIYVVMFLEILQTLIKVLILFSILIIAFGLAFFILLSNVETPQANHLSFSTIPMSLMRTFSMMLGEMDFVNVFVTPMVHNNLPNPYATFAILCKFVNFNGFFKFKFFSFKVLFMILMPILLMNLLIGLAVGDIESVKRNAQLKRLAMQVRF